jgi:hypothetical protein
MDIEALFGMTIGLISILTVPVLIIYLHYIAGRERREARDMYERIVSDRLSVIQSAIEAGFEDRELQRLDRRLQTLIGQQEMLKLVNTHIKKAPVAPDETLMEELEDEVENIVARRRRKQERELKRQIEQAGH